MISTQSLNRFYIQLAAGADGGFCDRGGLVNSGNMCVIAPIRTANGALF